MTEITGFNGAPTESTSLPDLSYRLAGFWTRFWALLIDIIVIAVSSQIIFRIAWPAGLEHSSVQSLVLYNGLFPGIWGVIYLILMTGFLEQTLGKMFMGIKVIQIDGHSLKWSTVIVRELFGRILSQLLGTHLGYLVCAFHPQKQALHDIVSDTCVVYVSDYKLGKWIHIPAAQA